MICEQVWELLDDYLAGELTETQAEPLSQHLRDCARCAEYLELLRAERSFLQQGLGRLDPDAALRRELERALAGSAPISPRWWPSLRVWARVAALFLAVVGVATFVLVLRTSRPAETFTAGPEPASMDEAPEGTVDEQVEQLLADISYLVAKVEILTSRPVLWDDQNGRFPQLTAELSRSQQHLIQQDREAVAAVTLAAANQHETVGDTLGSQVRRDFVLMRLPDTLAALSLAPAQERRQ